MQITTSLIERQQNIVSIVQEPAKNAAANRALTRANGKKIGVCIEANRDTAESVPYLTHQDFLKQIKELTDMCDYVVINLSVDGAKTSGLEQYYRNPGALEKLIKLSAKTRDAELGKLAAYEYEGVAGDGEDYLTSIKRQYQRNSVVSAHRPLALFLKIDPSSVFQKNMQKSQDFAALSAELCLKYGIDGLVLGTESANE